MATVQNMLPAGGDGQEGRMLPVLRQAGSMVKDILRDVDALDQKLTSIVSKMRQFSQSGSAFMNGMPYRSGLDLPSLSGGGGGGVSHIGMPMGSFSSPPALVAGGGGGSSPGGPWGWMRAAAAGAANNALNQAVAGMPSVYGNDVLYNRLRTLSGGTHDTQMRMMSTLAGGFGGGYYSANDLNSGVQSLFNMGANPLGGGLPGGLAAMGQLNAQSLASNVGTLQSMTTSNPMAVLRLRQMGVQMFDPRTGQLQSPSHWMGALQRATGANYHSVGQVQTDFSTYGPMRQMFKTLGLSDEQISNNILPQFLSQVPGGQSLTDTAVHGAQARATQSTQSTALQYHGLREGMDAANKAAEETARAFKTLEQQTQDLARAMGYAKGFTGALGTKGPDGGHSILGNVANSALHDLSEYLLFKKLGMLGGGAGAGAEAAGGGLISRTLGRVGLGGLAGRAALRGAGLAGVGLLAGQGLDYLGKHTPLGHHGGTILGDAARGAGAGALVGSVVPVVGTGIGAAVGGGLGAAWGARHDISSVAHSIGSFFGDDSSAGKAVGGMGNTGGPANGMMHGTINTQQLVDFAQKYIGTPYSWGGGGIQGPGRGFNQGANTVGFDCSSFVQFVFAHFGVMLPRTTYEQVKCGQAVSASQVMAGDLLFFGAGPDHVGVYLGNGQMINAPHTGTDIRIDSVNPASCSAIRRVTRSTGAAVTMQGGSNSAANNTAGLDSIQSASAAVASILGTGTPSLSWLGGAAGSAGAGLAAGSGMASHNSGPVPPQKSGKGAYSIKQLAALAQSAGFSGTGLLDAVAVALAESGGNANATGYNTDAQHSVDRGLWQINSYWHPEVANPFDPAANAAAAFRISGGGHSWRQWSTWNNGSAEAMLPKVQAAMNSYSTGAWRTHREVAQIHDDEMILPKQIADAVRGALSGHGGGGSGGSCSVVLKVYPTSADHAAAVKLATMVKDLMDHDNHLNEIGQD